MMRLIFKINYKIPLSVDQCLAFLQKEINEKSANAFKYYSWQAPFRFYKRSKSNQTFYLRSSHWAREFWIIGSVKQKNGNSIISIKRVPPLWFYLLLLWLVPFFFLASLGVSQRTLIVIPFWLVGAILGTTFDIKTSIKIFDKLKEVIISMPSKTQGCSSEKISISATD